MTPFQAAYRKFKKLSSTEPGNNLSSEDIKTIFALSNHDYDGIDQPFFAYNHICPSSDKMGFLT